MDEEVAILLSQMTEKESHSVANTAFTTGKLKGIDIVLLKSGIGKVNAALATAILHERFSPTHVINTGSAGGFASHLEVGDIVIGDQVIHHDVDVTAFNYEYGQVPGMPPAFSADERLVELANESIKSFNIGVDTGVIATGDSFMHDAGRVAMVRNRFPQVIAAEMEAAAIAQVCYQYSTPFVIIRALSDIAGKDASLSFDQFLELAAKNASNVLMHLIQQI